MAKVHWKVEPASEERVMPETLRISPIILSFLLIFGITEADVAVACSGRAGHQRASHTTSLINVSNKNKTARRKWLNRSLLLVNKGKPTTQICESTRERNTRMHSDTLAQTNGSSSQAIWKAVLFSHLPTYNTPPPTPVCLLFWKLHKRRLFKCVPRCKNRGHYIA